MEIRFRDVLDKIGNRLKLPMISGDVKNVFFFNYYYRTKENGPTLLTKNVINMFVQVPILQDVKSFYLSKPKSQELCLLRA